MKKQQNLTMQQNLAIRLLRVLRYNKARSERAIELMADEKKPLFNVVPFLLHINHPKFPGYIDDPEVPFGLNNYSLREEVTTALASVFPNNKSVLKDIKKIWPRQRKIDSLVLMGSIGTIAQSKSSDFDYWLCVDGSLLSKRQIELLQEKINRIEKWVDQHHSMEVHFFLSEIEKVKNNDFGVTDGESSGSAQAIFLKAEFYTTNIVVAGKAPFWWLMPDKTTDKQYAEIIETLKEGESPDPKWFMDLGNLVQMDPGEIFGAAIWQIIKGMDSPFKSVLKMAKLEVFLENIDNKQPLCNVLKKKVHNGAHAPGNLAYIDPYALMFDELIEHYEAVGKQDVVELLRLCLYIKCDGKLSVATDQTEQNFKRHIIANYVEQWGWSNEKVRKIDRLKYWDFKELSLLSRKIHSFLINCYRRISAQIDQSSQTVSKEDMTVLGRKIDTFYSKKDNKVEYLRSAFGEELYCDTVTIKAEIEANNRKKWSLYAGNQLDWENSAPEQVLMKSSAEPIELIVWAVWNRIVDGDTSFLLGYQTESVTQEDITSMATYLSRLFAPVKVAEIPRELLLVPPRVLNCISILNFESRRFKPEVETVNTLYINTWGELYHVKGIEETEELRFDLVEAHPQPETYLYAPDGTHKKRLYDDCGSRIRIKYKHQL